MEYRPTEWDARAQQLWRSLDVYRADFPSDRNPFYVLDMFPYPSGAGLHVGHPLGYIASDIVSRFKRHQGFNVLHPMGFDAFGLPAEQYAIQTGQHPAVTTEVNIERYREQLNRLGLGFDWSREVQTCDPDYYRWTQWIFIQLFGAWYNKQSERAEPIETLVAHLNARGTEGLNAAFHGEPQCSAAEWAAMDAAQREALLQHFRLAYRSESLVNWCPALGTVLANDEVVNGLSERGGHPVVQKPMLQWSMRISAFSQRLLDGLDELNWSDSIKESQRHWIGRSQGARIRFKVLAGGAGKATGNQQRAAGGVGEADVLEVFSTRPDTIFGATFMVVAPEHPMLGEWTTEAQRAEVEAYCEQAARRSERDRQADTKTVGGVFTGTYVEHPFTGAPIPVWTSDYVLMGYGTGAVMAVPGHDSRDHALAKAMGLPIVQVVASSEPVDVQAEAYEAKSGRAMASMFLDGLATADAIDRAISELELRGLGERTVQYRLRDAVFGRQRYWGEPIPIAYRDGVPEALPVDELPLKLPVVDKYLPTEDGEPPLARAERWVSAEGLQLETTTMPGWAGSSWYFLRYMDPKNANAPVDRSAADYWGQVDLYVGGSEHATGHLLYSRFWTHALHDLGHIGFREPFKRLVNQGMIQGISAFVHRVEGTQTVVSAELAGQYSTQKLHVDVSLVNERNEVDRDALRTWMPSWAETEFIPSEGPIKVEREVEKMSKSKYNVVNPDALADQYGADAVRLFEMFLGPIEQSKPWDTQGMSGVVGFLKKSVRLMEKRHDGEATPEELRTLHQLIDKLQRDVETLSFNTSVSAMMIAVNAWSGIPQLAQSTLRDFAVLLEPFAPHTAEALWAELGGEGSVVLAPYPVLNPEYLVKDSINYPVQFNGKTRFQLEMPASASAAEVEAAVMAHEKTAHFLEGRSPKKVIVVPGRIVNVVG
ncbi:MAG: leucine--tRNA ligase [Cryomorphaceae bacterium BACL18 MAG-120924-bin36]|nr:MAG: leucine--tRNA ligase [Cryomorphaceae bacterium BACL18 MAG-120924-bin36]